MMVGNVDQTLFFDARAPALAVVLFAVSPPASLFPSPNVLFFFFLHPVPSPPPRARARARTLL